MTPWGSHESVGATSADVRAAVSRGQFGSQFGVSADNSHNMTIQLMADKPPADRTVAAMMGREHCYGFCSECRRKWFPEISSYSAISYVCNQ